MTDSVNNSQLKFAGDVNIELIEIISSTGVRANISNMVTEVQIFEDIFKPSMTGSLAIRDSRDLPNIFNFIGQELVRIVIKTPGLDEAPENIIDKTFAIYKLDDRQMLKDRLVYYKLHFCSREMIIDTNIKLSKTYSGNISDIITTVVKTEGLKSQLELAMTPTINKVKYTSNYWSPYKNIKYLSERAMNKNNCANFLFFENRKGLNFVSLDDLYKQPIVQTYTYDNFSREWNEGTNSSVKNAGKDYSKFIDYKIDLGFDFLRRNTSGVYGSKLISHDITTKKYSTKNYVMFNNFNKEIHLNKFPIGTIDVASRVNSNIYNYPKYNSLYNGFGDDNVQKWLQNRVSLMGQLESFRLTAEVIGRTDMTVGQTVNVQLYKVAPVTAEQTMDEILDKMFSGNYLITAINHRFVMNKHEAHLELMKDSLISDVTSGK